VDRAARAAGLQCRRGGQAAFLYIKKSKKKKSKKKNQKINKKKSE
jgi:hypothetical protein